MSSVTHGDPAEFEHHADVLIRTHGGVQALQRMDAAGVIRSTVPLNGNEEAVGLDLTDHDDPVVRATLARALGSGRPAATSVIDLAQGGRGFVVYAPAADGGPESYGAAFRLSTVVAECLPDSLLQDRFRVDVLDGLGHLIHSSGAREFDGVEHHDVHVRVVDRGWTLRVYPSDAFVAASRNPNILPLLAGWIGLSLIGTFLLRSQLARECHHRDSEAHLSQMLDLAKDAILTLDGERRITHFNMGADVLFGWSPDDVHGRPVTDLVPCGLTACLDTMRAHDLVAVRRDGTTFPVEVTATDVVRDDGAEYVLIVRDITARREAERMQARLLRAIEHTADAIVVTDASERIEYVNPAFERLSGYGPEDVIGKSPRLLKSGHHPESFYKELRATLDRHDMWAGRFVNRHRDGETYEVDCTISVLRDASGEVDTHIAVQRDVTYLRQVEDRLRDSHRMEAIGRLAGGVAHDFNNMLTVMEGHASLLGRKLAAGSPELTRVERILEAVHEAARMTHNLLAFSKRQVLEPQAIALNGLVESAVSLLRPLIGEDVQLALDLDPDLPPVVADASQLEQVLLNLVVNARDAMPNGGVLSLSTRFEPPASDGEPGLDAPCVILTVRDTGVGMDEATRARIFDPFFTTKPRENRSGLGLSTVYGIVEQTGGTVNVLSAPGEGAAFVVRLPTAVEGEEARPRDADVDAPEPPSDSRSVRVLVVEDEDVVRELAGEILASLGFDVRAAEDGLDALRLLDEESFRPDVLVTDVVMPHMNGRELAGLVRERFHGISVLYVSGYSADALRDGEALQPRTGFLPKPYGPSDLERGIRELLGEETSAAAVSGAAAG